MDAEKINLFLSTKGEKFPADAIPMIRERLESLPADREMAHGTRRRGLHGPASAAI